MNTLTKTQVIALLIGSASATATGEEIAATLNGPAAEGTTYPEGQAEVVKSSLTDCNGNADCGADGESCGAFSYTTADAPAVNQNKCVVSDYCGALGKTKGVFWSIQCWETPAEGEVANQPDANDPTDLFTALKGLITDDDNAAAWDAAQTMWVSPLSRFQDGWFIQEEDETWTVKDKIRDNHCGLQFQCGPPFYNDGVERCCAKWPDTNNQRCMETSKMGVLQTIGPVKFTPSCTIDPEPENAEEVEAREALAEASEELKKFAEGLIADLKVSEGYDDMSAEDQKAFDEKIAAQTAEEDEWTAKYKQHAGYDGDSCDNNCKAAFEADQLVWAKEVYEACKINELSVACQKAFELREDEEKARGQTGEGAKNYYNEMDAEEREAFKKNRKEDVEKEEAALAAAFLADNEPQEASLGGYCGNKEEESWFDFEKKILDTADEAYVKCFNIAHCCGVSTPKDGAFVNKKLTQICADKTTKIYKDGLGAEYTHECYQEALAKRVAATAAAAVVLAYSLM